jgi:CMP-N-acetylneuraminic acid synthetase
MNFAVFILARKGSQRLPGKNTMEFTTNKNLVDVAILKANGVGASFVMLSTDIKDIIRNYENWNGREGLAKVIERPEKHCGSDVSSETVLYDMLANSLNPTELAKLNYIVLIQPTTPLWSLDDFKGAQKEFERCGYSAMVSVNSRYEPNGAFYFIDTSTFLRECTLWPEGTAIYMMPDDRSIDINYLHEFRIAQAVNRNMVHTSRKRYDHQGECD